MRGHGRAALVAAAMSLALAGCTESISRWQLGFGRGTAIDVVTSHFLPPVRTRAMQVMRAYALQIVVTRLAEELPARSTARAVFASDLSRANGHLSELLYCIYTGQRSVDAAGIQLHAQSEPRDPCFFFESLLLDYTRTIFDLARRLGEIESIRTLNRRIVSGISVGALIGAAGGPTGAAAGALAGLTLNEVLDILGDVLVDLLQSGRTAAHLYYDFITLETYMLQTDSSTRRRRGPSASVRIRNAQEIAELGGDRDRLRRAYETFGEPIPELRHFAQMTVLQFRACEYVTSEQEARERCATPPEPLSTVCFAKERVQTARFKEFPLLAACRLSLTPVPTTTPATQH